MSDNRIKVISAKYPDEFERSVNELLSKGNWRVAETEMSVTDHHYYALLIQEQETVIDVSEKREPRVRWINEYKFGFDERTFASEEAAQRAAISANNQRIACVKFVEVIDEA